MKHCMYAGKLQNYTGYLRYTSFKDLWKFCEWQGYSHVWHLLSFWAIRIKCIIDITSHLKEKWETYKCFPSSAFTIDLARSRSSSSSEITSISSSRRSFTPVSTRAFPPSFRSRILSWLYWYKPRRRDEPLAARSLRYSRLMISATVINRGSVLSEGGMRSRCTVGSLIVAMAGVGGFGRELVRGHVWRTTGLSSFF